ncbi:MAG: PrsW family glutamic-type intramembrane protease [Chitinophagaceae bacterium]|nr:PrsW family glutamic-type intramembrane protease [Chitinophagaceae bacterium]
MVLFALSIAPGIAISLYFFFKDEYNREPRRHVIISFFLGMVSALLAGVIESVALALTGDNGSESILFTALKAFLIVGFTEEWCKYLMVKKYAFPKPEFDEPFDGIVYAVMVSMGFATLENILYVMEHGLATAIIRMFLSVPAHACFAVDPWSARGHFLSRLLRLFPLPSGESIGSGKGLGLTPHWRCDRFLRGGHQAVEEGDPGAYADVQTSAWGGMTSFFCQVWRWRPLTILTADGQVYDYQPTGIGHKICIPSSSCLILQKTTTPYVYYSTSEH